MLTVTKDQQDTPAAAHPRGSMLDEIVREGARRMLAAALDRTSAVRRHIRGFVMVFGLLRGL